MKIIGHRYFFHVPMSIEGLAEIRQFPVRYGGFHGIFIPDLNVPGNPHPFLYHEIGLAPVRMKIYLFVPPLQVAIDDILRQPAASSGKENATRLRSSVSA